MHISKLTSENKLTHNDSSDTEPVSGILTYYSGISID